MAAKQDISEKLGLEWLGPGSGTDRSSAASQTGSGSSSGSGPSSGPSSGSGPTSGSGSGPQVDATRALVGKQILSVLNESQDKSDRVYNLVDRLRLDISTMLSVVDYLESTGFIRVERDNYGNHTLRLTEAGSAWIA
jgi:predicted transcriptional regulator